MFGIVALALGLIVFIVFELFIRRRSAAPRDMRRIAPQEVTAPTFENRVIYAIQEKPGYWGKPGKDLIEVYKQDKLVGIVKCCEDSWAVSPALVAEMAKLRVWYHVKVAYIACGGVIPAEAKRAAIKNKVRLILIKRAI